MTERGLSERRSLALAKMSASAFRYAPRPDRNVELREQIQALANRHKRYGVGMIHLKLRQAGWPLMTRVTTERRSLPRTCCHNHRIRTRMNKNAP